MSGKKFDARLIRRGRDNRMKTTDHSLGRIEPMVVTWLPFPEIKPELGQVCIVAAGPDMVAQHVALIWDGEGHPLRTMRSVYW